MKMNLVQIALNVENEAKKIGWNRSETKIASTVITRECPRL